MHAIGITCIGTCGPKKLAKKGNTEKRTRRSGKKKNPEVTEKKKSDKKPGKILRVGKESPIKGTSCGG